ncbi:6008_t:CDS:2 [Acaulospora morrowiae]|uniref:Dolichyl-diphosphooligosaccharide--protein glycosyltransferase subunit OST2 n=1 Tax=Acaulospora morrowiae TaxID=94023 RepID=A0A9N9BDX5_9GLOM|nr:6008_t:CDS:2 [Acaulospora morrowiae]
MSLVKFHKIRTSSSFSKPHIKRLSPFPLRQMSGKVSDVVQKLWTTYSRNTTQSLKLIDAYLVFVLFSGIFQFIYCVLVGTYPYNAFLAGFISTVGSFVLAANLRIQTNPENSGEFKGVSPERAFADFAFCNILLHFFVVNFIG